MVNVVTAKPDLNDFAVKGEAEYGNYNSIKAKGMINVPIGDTLGVRLAGFYLNRDGYTKNLYDNSKIDGRDMYAVRGSLRWEPSATTTFDLMGYYFKEKDDRMRIQKQLCQRDPTGVLGCLNTRLDYSKTNLNSTFPQALSSSETFTLFGLPAVLGRGSLYGPDGFANAVEPADVRTVNTAYTPQYKTDELQIMGHLEQKFGAMTLDLTGSYQKSSVDSREDYYLGVEDRSIYANALNTLSFFAANGIPTGLPAPAPAFVPGSSAYFSPITSALIPNGPNGQLCTADAQLDNRGLYQGFSTCSDVPLNTDQSVQDNSSWSAEALLSSDFDGSFNFLLGAIYAESHVSENSYIINSFALDYVAGVAGTLSSFGAGGPPAYFATDFYRNNTMDFKLKSYGIFGEAYVDLSDQLKFTLGLRYNNDKKSVTARSTTLSFLNPFSNNGDPFDSPITPLTGLTGPYDADPGLDGLQTEQFRKVGFDKITGRAVLDYQITPDNLIYASYSRGYKSGGVNPPLSPIFEVPESFAPEQIDAFEIGTKNVFGDNTLVLNATAFYYKYKNLQLSRIVARTAVNNSINADIYGFEAEGIIRPTRDVMINLGFSWLKTKVAGEQYFADPRDPGAGDPNAVIIKDISNGANCAVSGPLAGGPDAFVNAINAGTGVLRGTTEFPSDSGIASSGAFGLCSVLTAQAAAVGNAFGGITVTQGGIEQNIEGNELPQAPKMKASAGIQYTANFDNGMTLIPRFDIAMTGTQYGNIFNGTVNRIPSFVQANAQIQLNGVDDRWFVRGFVQNLFDSSSITGQYLTDASTGLFTNVFTLEPRRYGIAVGASF